MNHIEGEIEVGRLMDFIARQQRDLEWIALKEYWRAKREGQEQQVVRLYGGVLTRALQRYNQTRWG